MWLRTSFLAGVAVALATGGYSVGLSAKSAVAPKDVLVESSLGEGHPLTVALQKSDLKASERARLVQVSNETAKIRKEAHAAAKVEAERLRLVARQRAEDVKALENAVWELSRVDEKPTGQTKARLVKAEKELLKAKLAQRVNSIAAKNLDLVVERKIENEAAAKTLEVLGTDARADVAKWVAVRDSFEMTDDFALMKALDNRHELQLTPQQVTKLQLLQSDFIRFFAPLREQYETLSGPSVVFLNLVVEGFPLVGKAVTVPDKPQKALKSGEVTLEFVSEDAKGGEIKVQGEKLTGNVVLTPKIVTGKAEAKDVINLVTKDVLTAVTTEGQIVLQDESNPELKRLEKELESLKQKYTLKTYSVLNTTQQLKLKELLGPSNRE